MRRSLWALCVVLLALAGCGSSGSSAIVAQPSSDYCYLTAEGASAIAGVKMASGSPLTEGGASSCSYIRAPGGQSTVILNIAPVQGKPENCGSPNPETEPESKVYPLPDGCVVTNSAGSDYPLGVSIEVYGIGVIALYTETNRAANPELPPNIEERLVEGGKAIGKMLTPTH